MPAVIFFACLALGPKFEFLEIPLKDSSIYKSAHYWEDK
jgi:hypothetical protein